MQVRTDFALYKPLSVELDDNTGRWVLARPFIIIVKIDNNRNGWKKISVPAGFDTDFSSYPWLTRNLVRFNRVAVAGTVHDYLYRTGEMPRKRADRVWRLVAQHGGASANLTQAWVSWAGLRLGGWLPWWRNRRAT